MTEKVFVEGVLAPGTEIFRVTVEGRIIRNDIDVTDNDTAMAEVFCQYLKEIRYIKVNRTIKGKA